jgi:sterol desaturase/sphingolipid hydroxylase (fatty acid hydroxylase superfamily)
VTSVVSEQFRREIAIRLIAALTVFAAMALAEAAMPRRDRSFSRRARWPANLAIAAINEIAVRILLPITAIGAALAAEQRASGLLYRIPLPGAIALVIAVIALDLAIYLQHRVFHAVPLLWRIHRMHHADLDFDVSTGLRFHPLEIMLSMLIKIGVVLAIGASAMAVVAFEVLLNATSMFNHANLEISEGTDRWLRWILVTPDMHRVHHSIVRAETNSNFGFNLPWWDHLMRTYRAQPGAGHLGMTLGIDQFRSSEELNLLPLLTQPFRGLPGGYPTWTKLPP